MRNSDVVSSSWRKSSFSEAGNCVEVAGVEGLVLVRDTKLTAGGGVLSFPSLTWREFVNAVNEI